jgi:Flp pilus assembly protein TadD
MNIPAARASFYRAALEPLARARTLAPNDETFLIALGRVYDSLGRFAEAEWMFGQARDWDPRSEVVQKSYAAHLSLWRGESDNDEAARPQLTLPDRNAPPPLPSASPSL